MSRQRVVILGHTGFIGRALQTHLQNEGREALGFSSGTVDLRLEDGLRALKDAVDHDTVVIFASAITRDRGDTLGSLLDNIAMAGHLGAFLETHPPARCVCFSSDAVYAMQEAPITEDTPVEPGGNFYAIAKYSAECVIRRSAEAKGIAFLALRPTGVFGPGDTHNSYGPNAFLRGVSRDRTIRLFGEGEEKRDHLYIGDLVRLVSHLIDTEASGLFNLATGHSRSFAEVVEALRRSVPRNFVVSHLPRRGPITHRHFDISKLIRQLPNFSFTDIEDAMSRTYRQLSTATRPV